MKVEETTANNSAAMSVTNDTELTTTGDEGDDVVNPICCLLCISLNNQLIVDDGMDDGQVINICMAPFPHVH